MTDGVDHRIRAPSRVLMKHMKTIHHRPNG